MTITGYVSQDKALVVRGMTSNAGALLAYAQMLEDQGWFKNVAVTDIVAAPNGDDSQGASFVLSVSRT
jgi:uracil phosphoribosyltransferase